MKPNALIGLALVGGAAWFAYKAGLLNSVLGVAPGAPLAPGATPPVDQGWLRTEMLKRASNWGLASTLNADQWNAIYADVRGVAGPDPEVAFSGKSREFLMNIDDYLKGTGLSGLGMLYPTYSRSPYVAQGQGDLFNWLGSPAPLANAGYPSGYLLRQ